MNPSALLAANAAVAVPPSLPASAAQLTAGFSRIGSKACRRAAEMGG
ncbi:hypothetical protein [Bradyrhizobium sp.]